MADLRNEIFLAVNNLLEGNLGKISEKLTEFSSVQVVTKVYKGEKKVISKYPAIRLVPRSRESEWGATRSQDDTYNFGVQCIIKTAAEPEVAIEWLNAFESATMNVLLDPPNLQLALGNGMITYDSYATSAGEPVNTGEGMYVGEISYFTKVWNSPIRV